MAIRTLSYQLLRWRPSSHRSALSVFAARLGSEAVSPRTAASARTYGGHRDVPRSRRKLSGAARFSMQTNRAPHVARRPRKPVQRQDAALARRLAADARSGSTACGAAIWSGGGGEFLDTNA